ncbi:uncharacterized protein LOC142615977 [Castanea sativa]|uniref:uncharacterized protein LOC142615977 n=1 Tax=Castanea sativa TaxID=21020 RepID=UPI003F64E25F
MVLNVLNFNTPMSELNETNITLVPKIKHPIKMKDFRPISLSNVAYKLISKVLANRLKAILPQIISENQGAFISKRLITDNILVAFELMHYLDHKKDGRDSFMAIKLDMSKAYDRVKWKFIEANSQECHKLVEILELYEAASGQKVNTNKSSVFFSHNTTPEIRMEVLDILGPMQDTRHSKYLGLPSVIGKSKIQVFAEIKEKGGEKALGLEGKDALNGREGNSNKGSSTSSHLL